MTSDEYIEKRVQDQIDWYNRKSQSHQKKYKTLRTIEIIAAALIPFLTGLTAAYQNYTLFGTVSGGVLGTITVGVLGMIIAVIAGVLSLGRYQEQWIEYRTICESLKKEKFLFETGAEPYTETDSFNLLVQRAETLISNENTKWSQYMLKPAQEKKDGKT